jgi:hypothetical protein
VEFFLAPTELMLAPTASLCGVSSPPSHGLLSPDPGPRTRSSRWPRRESAWRSFTCCCRAAGGGVIHRRGATALRRPGRKGCGRGWWLAAWCVGGGGRPSGPRGRKSGALLREGRRRDELWRGWAMRGGVDREEGLGKWEGLQR